MNLAEWLVRTARRLPNAPALLSGKNVIADYAEYGRRVAVLASALQARLGIGRGDRVAIVMSNSVEYLELLYAIWFAGAARPCRVLWLPTAVTHVGVKGLDR